jgi:hypothetical protein
MLGEANGVALIDESGVVKQDDNIASARFLTAEFATLFLAAP